MYTSIVICDEWCLTICFFLFVVVDLFVSLVFDYVLTYCSLAYVFRVPFSRFVESFGLLFLSFGHTMICDACQV